MMTSTPQPITPTWYSRSSEGSVPVSLIQHTDQRPHRRYRVQFHDGTEWTYSTGVGLLAGLGVGSPTAWSVGRYFKQTVPDSPDSLRSGESGTSGTVWDILDQTPDCQPPSVVVPLGIDLTKRGHEVRKLLYAGFSLRLARGGHDPEEVLQEVYRGILARNVGKCPFDARKASFGHYVHLVITGVLCNYHKKEVRRKSVEQIGVNGHCGSTGEHGSWGNMDVSESILASSDTANLGGSDLGMEICGGHVGGDPSESGTVLIRFLVNLADREELAVTDTERLDIRTIVPYLVLGMTKPEIVRATGLSGQRVQEALDVVRTEVGQVI